MTPLTYEPYCCRGFFVATLLTIQLMNARTGSLYQACFRKSDLLNLSDLFRRFRHRHTFHFYALTHHLFFSLYASPPHSLSVSQSRFTLFLSLTRSFSLFHFYESFCVSSFIQGHSFKNVVVQEDLKKISLKEPPMIFFLLNTCLLSLLCLKLHG